MRMLHDAPGSAGSRPASSPLWLLIRVNATQAHRRLLSIRDQSRLLSSFIGLFIAAYLCISFLLFRKGLGFVSTFPGLGGVLIERMLYLLFALLFVMLLFSNLIISYTNLFRNRETHYLMPLPVPVTAIFQWKFIESTLLASWAFLFLIAPLLAAYGIAQGVAWHFYVFTLGLIGLFIMLPAVAGAWVAVNVARFIDRRLFQILAVGGVLLLLAASTTWLQPEQVTDQMLETRVLVVLDKLLQKTRFALHPLLPSYWLSTSVLQWSERAYYAASFFALVLLSHALFFGYIALTGMGGLFYEASSAVHSRGSVLASWGWFRAWRNRKGRSAYPAGRLERMFQGLFRVRPDVSALLAKDIRVFWRDTTQWGQTIVLFGLLAAYAMNLRHFSQQLTNPYWVHLVSYLNLAACSLNLATLTTRFVYPQFSLEGKRIWIIGMAPIGLGAVVRTKFALATAAALVVTLSLMALSCNMLKMGWDRTFYFMAAVAVMTFTLNGLAIGIGVLFPNLKEENPGKIVSGFGGTLCLILSFLYILCSVLLLAVSSPWARAVFRVPAWMAAGWVSFALLSVVLGWLPLKIAFRRLERFEI